MMLCTASVSGTNGAEVCASQHAAVPGWRASPLQTMRGMPGRAARDTIEAAPPAASASPRRSTADTTLRPRPDRRWTQGRRSSRNRSPSARRIPGGDGRPTPPSTGASPGRACPPNQRTCRRFPSRSRDRDGEGPLRRPARCPAHGTRAPDRSRSVPPLVAARAASSASVPDSSTDCGNTSMNARTIARLVAAGTWYAGSHWLR